MYGDALKRLLSLAQDIDEAREIGRRSGVPVEAWEMENYYMQLELAAKDFIKEAEK